MALFVGLISGTSMDGIDAALVSFAGASPRVLATHREPYSQSLRRTLLCLAQTESVAMDELFSTDVRLGERFARAANRLIDNSGVARSTVRAIGSHGQTVRHRPSGSRPYSVQLADPNTIAERTGITTVADFRRRDMAAGGQGAPLASAFHALALAPRAGIRAVVNIGGIANVTFVGGPVGAVTGFDTGPGNALMDGWMQRHRGLPFDDDGAWAGQGEVLPDLLAVVGADPYFRSPPPRSTGREHFNLAWLDAHLRTYGSARPEDVQRTLCELTARTIADAVSAHGEGVADVAVCGGGVHNGLLLSRLRQLLAPRPVASTATLGVDPDWLEAIAFAWLAERTLSGQPGNIPTVTGARRAVVLGGIYPVPPARDRS